MGILRSPSFFITYAVIQTLLFLFLIRILDLYEHEPFSVLAAMAMWGAVGATALSAIGNGIITRRLPEDIDLVFGVAISAPVVEEVAKGLALLAAFVMAFVAHRRFGVMQLGGVTDGIVYGAAVGLGFAFTEDIHYMLQVAAQRGLDEGFHLFLARRDFFGTGALHHAIFTAAFGAGLGLATWSRSRIARVGWALTGLLTAIALHATNNGLVQVALVARHGFDRTAAALASVALPPDMEATKSAALTAMAILDFVVVVLFAVAIAVWLRHQRKVIGHELKDEIESGLIDPRDGELVPSYHKRLRWYWQLVRVGEWERFRAVKRLHIELAGLAFQKWRSGKDSEDAAMTRQRIATLKAQSAVDVYAPR